MRVETRQICPRTGTARCNPHATEQEQLLLAILVAGKVLGSESGHKQS